MVEPFHLFYILHSDCINVTLVCGEDVFDDTQAGAIDDNDKERQY